MIERIKRYLYPSEENCLFWANNKEGSRKLYCPCA
jgi:hypothetical protein